jgi:hypothetical protein
MHLSRIISTLKQKYQEEKAALQGVALSRARMVKQAQDIPEISQALKPGVPKPIKGAHINMAGNKPMTFFTDGSIRSAFGPKPDISGRQFRKQVKALRRARKAAK